MEFGPRALVNRSIIGDARNIKMQTKIEGKNQISKIINTKK